MSEIKLPVYFFDFDDGLQCFKDKIGSNLHGLQEARHYALNLFKEVGLDGLLSSGRGKAVVTVRDVSGGIVFGARLTLSSRVS